MGLGPARMADPFSTEHVEYMWLPRWEDPCQDQRVVAENDWSLVLGLYNLLLYFDFGINPLAEL